MKFSWFAAVISLCFPAALLFAKLHSPGSSSQGYLFVANQGDHTALLINLDSKKVEGKAGVDINGHEVAVSPDRHYGFVPIYGNSGVGKPGTDGATVQVVDLNLARTVRLIDLGKPVRPHCAKFGPDGNLYVSAELDKAIYIVEPATGKIIGKAPTGANESHMLVLTPDGQRAYTANVGEGSVSVVDLRKRSLITVIPVAKIVQRISISPDGKSVFTHDQQTPRIAVIDTATNKLTHWIDLPDTVYSSQPTPDGKLLIANAPSGKLFVIDLATEKVVANFPIPPAVGAIAIDASGSHAYVSCPAHGSIETLNVRENKMEPPIALTTGVDGLQWIASLP